MSQPAIADLLERLVSSSPHTHALGLTLAGLDGDLITLKAPYREDLIGDPDTKVLAGGVVTAVLDHACGMAVWAAMNRFASIATLDLRIDYMRPAKPGLDLMAQARCYKLTRSVAFVRAWAYDEDPEDPVAAAQSAFMLDSDAGRKPGANLRPSSTEAGA